ncbi:proline-rich proteoglycan 2-like [Cavia porcellus]|uniref:proline-rich proteoglycan 2-like n=1 Tax=Cavia porcellus TaxID=10141 RepID=UPI002FDF28CC
MRKSSPQGPARLHTPPLGPAKDLLQREREIHIGSTEAPKPPRGSPYFRPQAPPPLGRSARPPGPARARRVTAPPFPPPGPNRTNVRSCRSVPGPGQPRPSRPPHCRRPGPAGQLTGSQGNRVYCSRPAPVPSSSRSNCQAPPAQPRDDLTRTPLVTRRRTSSSSPGGSFYRERLGRAPGGGAQPLMDYRGEAQAVPAAGHVTGHGQSPPTQAACDPPRRQGRVRKSQ